MCSGFDIQVYWTAETSKIRTATQAPQQRKHANWPNIQFDIAEMNESKHANTVINLYHECPALQLYVYEEICQSEQLFDEARTSFRCQTRPVSHNAQRHVLSPLVMIGSFDRCLSQFAARSLRCSLCRYVSVGDLGRTARGSIPHRGSIRTSLMNPGINIICQDQGLATPTGRTTVVFLFLRGCVATLTGKNHEAQVFSPVGHSSGWPGNRVHYK